MPLEFRKEGGQLVWVRSPFTGTVTYFTAIHRKQSGFRRAPVAPSAQQPDWQAAEAERVAELEAAQRDCPFCPGNEEQTTAEILRVAPSAVPGSAATTSSWLIRAFNNLFPRVPESCTGGRNESYVVVKTRATLPTARATTTSCSTPRCYRRSSSAPSCTPTSRSRASRVRIPPYRPS
jgi:hypothetical protein